MNTKTTRVQILAIIILGCLSTALPAASSLPADNNRTLSISGTGGIVTRAFTGVWNQPALVNQSTVIQIIDNNMGGLDAVVYWFGLNEEGIPFWNIAEGPVIENRIDLTIYRTTNPALLSLVGTGKSKQQALGTGTIKFDNCISGTFSNVDSISGTGGFVIALEKATGVANTKCAGGTSDGVNPSDAPVDIVTFLTPSALGAGSTGRTEFEISAGRTNFEVTIKDLPVGVYGLNIDGINKGNIRVTSQASGGTMGAIEFRSPVEPGKVLLTFDPRGKLIDVINSATTVVLSQLFPLEAATGTGGLPGGTALELDIDMINAGVYPEAEAKAEFEQRPDRSEFSVEMEDIQIGSYELFVGNVYRGSIDVADSGDETTGEIEFRSPLEAGKDLLDFDPRNQLIEIFQGSTLLFSSNFPSNNPVPSGSFNMELDLKNTGIDAEAEGELLYKKFGERTRIEVAVENLSVDGRYKLFINNTHKANIQVEDGEGRWGFRSSDLDKAPFPNGNPIGAKVSVKFNGVDILSVTISE